MIAMPTAFQNDPNTAALGEFWVGRHRVTRENGRPA
jgi:hypothetical protein